MSTVIPYESKELKGVWIRPTYFDKKQIEEALNKTITTLAEVKRNNKLLSLKDVA